MQTVATLEDYLAQPVGRCLCGPTYAVWWSSPRLNGILLWGRPDEDDIRFVTSALDAELDPGVDPHASLIDTRYVHGVDLGAFNALSRYVRSRSDLFSRVVARQAVLRPGGLAGAAIAGFYAVVTPSYPVSVFTEPSEALEWLGTQGEGAVVGELEDVHRFATGGCSLVFALHAYLEQHAGSASIGEVARALGTSVRNLQRKLREAHTCFQVEQNRAQMRVAKTLLLETNYDLKRIGIEVGCASSQHFSTLFRKQVGATPGEWRTAHLPIEMGRRRDAATRT